jgi:hypothetical protein
MYGIVLRAGDFCCNLDRRPLWGLGINILQFLIKKICIFSTVKFLDPYPDFEPDPNPHDLKCWIWFRIIIQNKRNNWICLNIGTSVMAGNIPYRTSNWCILIFRYHFSQTMENIKNMYSVAERDVYPGSEFFSSRIRIKEFKYFNPKKWFLSSRKYDPECSSPIRILTFYSSWI